VLVVIRSRCMSLGAPMVYPLGLRLHDVTTPEEMDERFKDRSGEELE
jgi:hypothetical protein